MSVFGDDGKITGEQGIEGKNKTFCPRGMCKMNGNKKLGPFWQQFWVQRTRAVMAEGERGGRLRGVLNLPFPFPRQAGTLVRSLGSIPGQDGPALPAEHWDPTGHLDPQDTRISQDIRTPQDISTPQDTGTPQRSPPQQRAPPGRTGPTKRTQRAGDTGTGLREGLEPEEQQGGSWAWRLKSKEAQQGPDRSVQLPDRRVQPDGARALRPSDNSRDLRTEREWPRAAAVEVYIGY